MSFPRHLSDLVLQSGIPWRSNTTDDSLAVERHAAFRIGAFSDPVYKTGEFCLLSLGLISDEHHNLGTWPKIMTDTLPPDYLPRFSEAEQKDLLGESSSPNNTSLIILMSAPANLQVPLISLPPIPIECNGLLHRPMALKHVSSIPLTLSGLNVVLCSSMTLMRDGPRGHRLPLAPIHGCRLRRILYVPD